MVIDVPQAGMDYVLYGDKSNVISNYLYNQMQNLPTAFNAFSQKVHDSLMTSYNYVNDKLTQYGIMNQLSNSGVKIVDNYFEELLSFQQLQNANLTMQRWVMTHPQVREFYLNQNVDGYSDTYKNVFGKDAGDKDYNYRRVMDGMLQDNPDDSWVTHYYDEDLIIGDRELNHFEKVKILSTWDAMDWILNNCDFKYDFTCKSDEPVKRNVE